jgi:hypothetical protein
MLNLFSEHTTNYIEEHIQYVFKFFISLVHSMTSLNLKKNDVYTPTTSKKKKKTNLLILILYNSRKSYRWSRYFCSWVIVWGSGEYVIDYELNVIKKESPTTYSFKLILVEECLYVQVSQNSRSVVGKDPVELEN